MDTHINKDLSLPFFVFSQFLVIHLFRNPQQLHQPTVDSGKLPQAVAELPQNTEAPESIPYKISFAKYNDKLCEISALGKNKGNRALLILKEIGTKVFSRADFQKNQIRTDPVANSGEYMKLYNRLGPDIEVRELFLQSTGRIFYFDVEPDRVLYVVAIRENHFETDRVRR